jgi:peptidoglycan/xylan/chitin deacetylase (PgdA/CDA1 family)
MGLLSLKMSLRGKITPFGRASPVSRDYDPGISALTFDNLGEAADLERGLMAPDAAVGRHPSVTVALPRLLDELDMLGLRATFFVEGWNADVYPEALQGIAARGHEVGLHGWRHEPWAELDPGRERELLERGVLALDRLGLRPVSFRPPGGDLTPASLGLLRELGFEYVSPAGEEVLSKDGITVIPFRWELVDAWYYLPTFDGPPEPSALRAAVMDALDGDAGPVTLIFHPFLLDTDERFEVLLEAIAH